MLTHSQRCNVTAAVLPLPLPFHPHRPTQSSDSKFKMSLLPADRAGDASAGPASLTSRCGGQTTGPAGGQTAHSDAGRQMTDFTSPSLNFTSKSSIRPAARDRPQTTLSERGRPSPEELVPPGVSEHLPALFSVSRRYNLSRTPDSICSTPRGLLLCCSASRAARSCRGRLRPAGGEEPTNQRPPDGEGCSQWRGSDERGDDAALFNGERLSEQRGDRPACGSDLTASRDSFTAGEVSDISGVTFPFRTTLNKKVHVFKLIVT